MKIKMDVTFGASALMSVFWVCWCVCEGDEGDKKLIKLTSVRCNDLFPERLLLNRRIKNNPYF